MQLEEMQTVHSSWCGLVTIERKCAAAGTVTWIMLLPLLLLLPFAAS
jgi:hypothetical protein